MARRPGGTSVAADFALDGRSHFSLGGGVALGALELIGGVIESVLDAFDLVGAVTGASNRRHSGRRLAAGWGAVVAGGAALLLGFAPLRERAGGWAVAAVVVWVVLLLYVLLASATALLAPHGSGSGRRRV